ncbi:MAG: DUF3422 domain-containing protein [Rhodobacteraceae bacterium]|nr:DUF3422 domain-containing protein [Paracoccaceae bacterium]
MSISKLPVHPDRVVLTNELHARPFHEVNAPARTACLAIGRDVKTNTDKDALLALLDHYGTPHPAPDANQMTARLGEVILRWERHTEFVTYALHQEFAGDPPFSGILFDALPEVWLNRVEGRLLTSVLVRVEQADTAEAAVERLRSVRRDWFVAESLAASFVLGQDALIAGDFRLDPRGHVRFAVFRIGDTGPQRIGRVVQRLIEIETYKSTAMLTLPIARDVFAQLDGLDREMGAVVNGMTQPDVDRRTELDRLLELSARVESFSADTAYRFSAAEAYSAIVHQRIEVLREQRVNGMQLFTEFMQRRFDPAMRTCRAAQARLEGISGRAARASRLLSTRVTVETNEQNRRLLEQMDRRAALQLRLQQTVEGLSVVAISYYATGLLAQLLLPFGPTIGMSEGWLTAILVPPVVFLVWLAVRRIRRLAKERVKTG